MGKREKGRKGKRSGIFFRGFVGPHPGWWGESDQPSLGHQAANQARARGSCRLRWPWREGRCPADRGKVRKVGQVTHLHCDGWDAIADLDGLAGDVQGGLKGLGRDIARTHGVLSRSRRILGFLGSRVGLDRVVIVIVRNQIRRSYDDCFKRLLEKRTGQIVDQYIQLQRCRIIKASTCSLTEASRSK